MNVARLLQCMGLLVWLLLVGCVSQQAQDRDAKNIKDRAQAHTDLGAGYLQQRQLEVALEEFSLAVQIDPTYGAAYNGLGLVYSALGQDTKAEQNFKKALLIDPNNSESHNNYGSFLCARKRYDESVKEFLAAVRNPLYATPAVAYTNAGICSGLKQDTQAAESYLQKALQIDPLLNTAAYQLALIQFNRNESVLAKKTLQNVVMNRPTPDILWLSIQIARTLGNQDEVSGFTLQLRRLYPESEQAKWLINGN